MLITIIFSSLRNVSYSLNLYQTISFLDWIKFKALNLQTINKVSLKNMIFIFDWKKTSGEKEKMLITSIVPFPTLFWKGCFRRVDKSWDFVVKSWNKDLIVQTNFNPLLDTLIFGSSNSAANKNMMSKIWSNGDTIIWLSRKHCGRRRNCSLWAISPFSTMFSKAVCCWCVKMSIYGVKD